MSFPGMAFSYIDSCLQDQQDFLYVITRDHLALQQTRTQRTDQPPCPAVYRDMILFGKQKDQCLLSGSPDTSGLKG